MQKLILAAALAVFGLSGALRADDAAPAAEPTKLVEQKPAEKKPGKPKKIKKAPKPKKAPKGEAKGHEHAPGQQHDHKH